jgi:glucokinase
VSSKLFRTKKLKFKYLLIKMTNLSWKIDGDILQKTFKIKSVRVMNDFEAIGYGIHELGESDLLCLNNSPKKYFTQ